MPKAVTFDQDAVLTAAMKVFWRQGYAATSMKDLEAATGLTTGSIYNSFNGKDDLFAMTLSHYMDRVVTQRINKFLNAEDARAGLEGFCRDTIENAPRLSGNGCFLVNTHVEGSLHTPMIRKLVAGGQSRIDDAVYTSICRAQKAKQITNKLDAQTLADRLNLILSGVLARSRMVAKPEWRQMAMQTITDMLDG